MEQKDIETLLEKWYDMKQEISELETKCDKYKRCMERIMDNKGVDIISSSNHKLKRKQITRATLSKKNVPKDLWDKYSRESTYPVYYLTEK